MAYKLHLMDDRNILKTEEVNGKDFAFAFNLLLDHILVVLETYPCNESDINKDFWEVIREDVATAKHNLPTNVSQVTDWRFSMFNMVVHEYGL